MSARAGARVTSAIPDLPAETRRWVVDVLRLRPRGFLTDIDGTLSPISDTPDQARLYRGVRPLLLRCLDQFDVVAAIFVQFADPAMRSFLFERMVRSLALGGLVLLIGYTPKQHEYKTGGPKKVENLYTEPMLRGAFSALEIVQLREYDAELAEGSQHCGPSALIDLVAKKPL